MKQLFTLMVCLLFSLGMSAQSLEELKSQKSELEAEYGEAQAAANGIKSQINALQSEITKLSGWNTGLNGIIGLDFNNSDNWAGNPNPNSSSTTLNLGATLFANKIQDKYFWRNKAIATKSYQDIDIDGEVEAEDDGLESTVDILNISSLYGYNITSKLALSALGELNSSIENFLEPGTVDLGVGFTWTPVSNLVVVVHPLNYRLAFSGLDAFENANSLGAKLRADYTRAFDVGGKTIAWSSTLTGFLPYSNNDPDPSLDEFTWLNNFSLELWKGIGVGINLGLRKADFETTETQKYVALGMSYGFNY